MFYLFKSKASFETETSRQAMEACEHIISEMGADLHDDLIQKLTVIRLHLDRLDRSKSNQTEIESLIVSLNADFQEVVQSIRAISRRLLPAKLAEDSLVKSIRLLCQNLERPGGGTIHFESTGSEQILKTSTEIYLYRIIQELIHNSIRHSSAWHIWVRLTWTPSLLIVEVEDDGTGFLKTSTAITSLKNKYNTLRMRTRVINANLDYLKGVKGLLARVECKIQNVK